MTTSEMLAEMKDRADSAKADLARMEGQIESEQNNLKELCGTTNTEEASKKLETMTSRYNSGVENHKKEVEELYNRKDIDWGF